MIDWRAGVLLGVALVVALGFAWYERSRPSSRVVALVAALAALAVAGRLVFTPLPNVVATTDVALITGYALGGPPGFAVGALAAPISNIWLGQGPWTIWQMAGWGLAGLAGAGLALASARRLGRVWLALACAAAGLLYGALLDLSVMVTYGGEQSLDRYLALSARGLPFNVAHAVGNFTIALAVGPALVRMISRFRERLEFRWHPAGAMPALLVGAALIGGVLAPADTARASAEGETSRWLIRQQNVDGGFPATPGGASSPLITGWVTLGLESAGINPLDVVRGGRTPVDYLRSNSGDVTSTGDIERTILALDAAGVSARNFAGRDLVAELQRRRGNDGSFEGQVNLTAFAILALEAAGSNASASSVRWLREAANPNGGWGIGREQSSDADSTGASLQALVAASFRGREVAEGASFLASSQRSDGSWSISGGASNSQSTSWAIQGLVAAGGPAGSISSGLSYLGARRRGNGSYEYSASLNPNPVWVTGQALTALTRNPFPLAVAPRGPKIEGGDDGGRGGTGGPSSAGEGEGFGEAGGSGGPGGKKRSGKDNDRRGESGGPGSDRSARDGAKGDDAAPLVADLADGETLSGDGEASGDGGMSDGAKVGAGLGGLALALGAGFLWYRRTLP